MPMLTLSLWFAPAFAWSPSGGHWDRESIPLIWTLYDDGSESGLPAGYATEAFAKAFENWRDAAPCAGLESAYVVPDSSPALVNIYFGDADDRLEPSVLWATLAAIDGEEMTPLWAGEDDTFDSITVVINDDIVWSTTADAEGGNCDDAFVLETVATYLVGGVWGLGKACEVTEACLASEMDATMNMPESACSTAAATPNEDDVEGIYSIYEVIPNITVTPTSGNVPLNVDLASSAISAPTSVRWEFGDGESVEGGASIAHTYTQAGNYSVAAYFQFDNPHCGTISEEAHLIEAVHACDIPAAEEGSAGMFALDRISETEWQTVNHVDASVAGCIQTVQWDVFAGDNTDGTPVQSYGAWDPIIEVSEPGTYTLVLNVAGPAGLTAESIQFEAGSGCGCSSNPTATRSVGGLLTVLIPLLLGRRRG